MSASRLPSLVRSGVNPLCASLRKTPFRAGGSSTVQRTPVASLWSGLLGRSGAGDVAFEGKPKGPRIPRSLRRGDIPIQPLPQDLCTLLSSEGSTAEHSTTTTTPSPLSRGLPASFQDALQPPYYAIIEIAGRPLLVTPNDVLTLHRFPHPPGSRLNITGIREFGTRTLTIRGNPYVSTHAVNVEAVVMDCSKGHKRKIWVKGSVKRGTGRTVGHRQTVSVVRITRVDLNWDGLQHLGFHLEGENARQIGQQEHGEKQQLLVLDRVAGKEGLDR